MRFALLFLLCPAAFAAINVPHGANGAVQAVAVQADGRAIVGGLFSAWNGSKRNALVRLKPDGSVDEEFDAEMNRGASVRAIAIAKTEKGEERILVGGSFAEVRGRGRRFLVRLKPNGSVDGSFDAPDGPVYAIRIQKDGKILVGGAFQKVDDVPRRGIARYLPDGSLDKAFTPGKGVEGTVHALAVTKEGNVYVGGIFIYIDSRVSPYIARLNPDGTFDPTFGSRLTPATEPNAGIFTLSLDSKDRLYCGGSFRFVTEEGSRRDNIVRLKADGSGDGGFNPGAGADKSVSAILALDGDKILVGGAFEGFSGFPGRGLVRVDEAGNVDRKFVSAGFDSGVLALARGTEDTLFAGGGFFAYGDSERNGLVRVDQNGAVKADYGPTFGPNDKVNAFVPAADGKLYVVGRFTVFGGRRQSRVARLSADGTLDASFGKDTEIDGAVRVAAVMKDGKLVIGGEFRSINGLAIAGLARLDANGVLDQTFVPGLAGNSKVNSLISQGDKVVVGGQYLNLNGAGVPTILRLNTDGSPDATFRSGSGTNGPVHTMFAQPDGKILVGGNFTNINGVARKGYGRILADGSVDATFDTGGGVKGDIFVVTLLPDGRSIVGGEFTTVKRRNLARFLATGELDVSFKPPAFGAQQPVHVLVPWRKKRIVLAGGFLRIADRARQRIAVIDEDGDLTGDLDNVQTDGAVTAMLAGPEFQLLLGGAFVNVNEASTLRIAEINADGKLTPASAPHRYLSGSRP